MRFNFCRTFLSQIKISPCSSRIWDYPVKEQFGSILMQIDKAKTLANASEGFQTVNQRDSNDFAFIHDANEIKYEAAK